MKSNDSAFRDMAFTWIPRREWNETNVVGGERRNARPETSVVKKRCKSWNEKARDDLQVSQRETTICVDGGCWRGRDAENKGR
ncbi:hypothetical protein TMatcc_002227 [Talaromyces marneffei ATCC 18224]